MLATEKIKTENSVGMKLEEWMSGMSELKSESSNLCARLVVLQDQFFLPYILLQCAYVLK